MSLTIGQLCAAFAALYIIGLYLAVLLLDRHYKKALGRAVEEMCKQYAEGLTTTQKVRDDSNHDDYADGEKYGA
jgi:hypothetical protein